MNKTKEEIQSEIDEIKQSEQLARDRVENFERLRQAIKEIVPMLRESEQKEKEAWQHLNNKMVNIYPDLKDSRLYKEDGIIDYWDVIHRQFEESMFSPSVFYDNYDNPLETAGSDDWLKIAE